VASTMISPYLKERLERDGMGRGESLLARGRHAFNDVWSLLKVLAGILYPRVVAVLPLPAPATAGGGGGAGGGRGGRPGALLLPAPSGDGGGGTGGGGGGVGNKSRRGARAAAEPAAKRFGIAVTIDNAAAPGRDGWIVATTAYDVL